MSREGALPPPITVEIKHALDNIKEVELPAEGMEDKVIWNQTPTREYTLKSDWNAIRKTMPRVGWNKLLWHRQVIPRYASCVWKESPSQETMRDPRVPPASELGGRDTRWRTAVLCVLLPLNSSQQYARNRITEPSSNRNNRSFGKKVLHRKLCGIQEYRRPQNWGVEILDGVQQSCVCSCHSIAVNNMHATE
ncbi:hypothetical protein COCNU_04G013340 [Cocos nucifera]|uniref:Uncharacterized protein n=1 Tax=Cocos nucifera TaxID=13894 RepID=A0A8K0I845_COCNU|nr:hypothetical protein COCNU_04G013340 [Cocos nucifera]